MMLFFILCSLLSTSDAIRLSPSELLHSDAHGQAKVGKTLRGRYRLEEFLERRSKVDATPGSSFPYISASRREFNESTPPTHLGQGSFGDVWKAYDFKLEKDVAVKIFYQGNQYMTWKNANSRGLRELKESAKECTLVKNILSDEHRKMYPIGASRICACYDEYITDAKGTSNVVFLVQEMCGQSLEKAIIGKRRQSQTVNYYKARQATKQMLQAIAFLQMFDPPLIHHDLKPANVCINDKEEIKIIDWGALVFGKSSAMFEPAAATPLFTPPEAASRVQSFAKPWHSYDSYAIGLMHMYFLCPFVQDLDWYHQRPLTNALVRTSITKRCSNFRYDPGHFLNQDLALIDDLANADPRSRVDPMTLVDHDALHDIKVPEAAEELLKFKVGDAIEYWSESYGEWRAGKVKYVNREKGLYNLVYSDGRHMRDDADPGRVRKLQRAEDPRATIDEKLKVQVGDRREGNGLRGLAVLDPFGSLNDKGEVVEPEWVGYSNIISVDAPRTRWTSRKTLEVRTYLRCDYGAKCDFDTVWMTCGSEPHQHEYMLHTIKKKSNLIRAKVEITRHDPMLGQNCEIEVLADISGSKISKKYHGRKKSYPVYVILEASGRRVA